MMFFLDGAPWYSVRFKNLTTSSFPRSFTTRFVTIFTTKRGKKSANHKGVRTTHFWYPAMKGIAQMRHFHPRRHCSNAQVYVRQALEVLILSQQPIAFQTPCLRHDARLSQLAASPELLQGIHHIFVKVFRWGMRILEFVDRVRRKSQKRRNLEKELYMLAWILPIPIVTTCHTVKEIVNHLFEFIQVGFTLVLPELRDIFR